MKIFISNILKFFTILLALIIIVILGYCGIINTDEYWSFPNNEEFVVLGSSRPTDAFNDSLIPNFVNVCSAGESYFYTQMKLRKIVENNPQLKTIFIEFGERDILAKKESWIWSDNYIRKRFATYLPIMNFEEFRVIFSNNAKSILTLPPKYLLREILYSYYNFMFGKRCCKSKHKRYGGFAYILGGLENSAIEEKKANKNDDIKVIIDNINLKYFDKMLKFCEQKKVKVCLLKTPVHEMSYCGEEKKTFEKILENNFSHISFLNFENFPLQNSEYLDFEHLNHKGAKKFSEWFAHILNIGLLENEHIQEFIDDEFATMEYNN